ncbi:hypothetical protein HK102_005123 [Quaeritorhiza haematococci]|nr:hypothetical protein HK102_005123 [Quaeritorhiza haematococci]
MKSVVEVSRFTSRVETGEFVRFWLKGLDLREGHVDVGDLVGIATRFPNLRELYLGRLRVRQFRAETKPVSGNRRWYAVPDEVDEDDDTSAAELRTLIQSAGSDISGDEEDDTFTLATSSDDVIDNESNVEVEAPALADGEIVECDIGLVDALRQIGRTCTQLRKLVIEGVGGDVWALAIIELLRESNRGCNTSSTIHALHLNSCVFEEKRMSDVIAACGGAIQDLRVWDLGSRSPLRASETLLVNPNLYSDSKSAMASPALSWISSSSSSTVGSEDGEGESTQTHDNIGDATDGDQTDPDASSETNRWVSQALFAFTHLKSIDLAGSGVGRFSISLNSLSELPPCTSVANLSFRWVDILVAGKELEIGFILRQCFPHLTSLHLQGYCDMTEDHRESGAIIGPIVDLYGPNMTDLTLHSFHVTLESLLRVAEGCPNLQAFSVDGSWVIDQDRDDLEEGYQSERMAEVLRVLNPSLKRLEVQHTAFSREELKIVTDRYKDLDVFVGNGSEWTWGKLWRFVNKFALDATLEDIRSGRGLLVGNDEGGVGEEEAGASAQGKTDVLDETLAEGCLRNLFLVEE